MLSEQEIVRREKLEKISAAGIRAYPDRYETTHTLAEASKLEDATEAVAVAGRLTAIRQIGRLTFATLQDIHAKYQICMKADNLEKYDEILSQIDIGDFIGVKGSTFTTKKNEKTLQVKQYTFLGKCLRPLPEKWHGLTDIESRYRQRYLDLIVNPETQQRMLFRTTVVREVRRFLEDRSFIEVETPVLQAQASGALARPFKTHHNALDADFYLRIAPETYLKRLIVGGFNHVFEIARCFRNEGIGPNHLQEFTMVEGYSAYWNFQDNMKLMRELMLHIVSKMSGNHVVVLENSTSGKHTLDLSEEWETVTFRELLKRDIDLDIDQFPTAELLLAEIKRLKINLEEPNVHVLGRGNLIDLLYKRVSRPKLIKPTFLVSHPIDLSPLARANDNNPQLTDRFQVVVNGVEIVNAYSELVDPIEQAKRLELQAQAQKRGDQDAMVKEDDYVIAMEYGMPPISGWGFGIERLVQFLTACENIKDCVLFPLSKPKND
ncbi:MAG: lysine--tRNA ligase [Bdellovibrionaceae bacterium]|nr:lysine--tRNA ligase [Pseudobdellovibrionaceae bacterium]